LGDLRRENIRKLNKIREKISISEILHTIGDPKTQEVRIGKKLVPLEVAKQYFEKIYVLWLDFPTEEWEKERVKIVKKGTFSDKK
jgi:hypothetical protein